MTVDRRTNRLLRRLDIRPGEQRLVALLLLRSLCTGATISLAFTSAAAIFLAAFGAAQLPWVYIAAAAIIIVAGGGYRWLGARLPLARLALVTLGFLALTGLLFRIGLGRGQLPWLAFGVLIWYRLVYSLSGLEFWSVAGSLLTLQQGKRLFGIVGTGEVLAKLLGYALVPLLVSLLGTLNLMALAVGLIAVNMALSVLLFRTPGQASIDASAPKSTTAARRQVSARPQSRTVNRRYVLLIGAGSLLTMLVYFLIDFGFLREVKGRFVDADAMATFVGAFSTVAYGGGLLLRSLAANQLLRRFGLRFGVLVLPLALILPAGLLALAGALASGFLLFWVMVVAQLFNDLLRNGIYRTTFVLLYQPLDRPARLAAQTTAESVFEPLGIALAGAGLLLFNTMPGFASTHLGVLLLTLVVIWAAVLIWTCRDYVRTLAGALIDRSFEAGALRLDDADSLATVRRALGSSRPAEVIYGLELLERSTEALSADTVRGLLQHHDAAVRATAAVWLERRPNAELATDAAALALHDPDATVRRAALGAWVALDPDGASRQLLPQLASADTARRQAVSAALLRAGDATARRAVNDHLQELAQSADWQARLMAADVLTDAAAHGDAALLATLVADDDPRVARAALGAIGAQRPAALWPAVTVRLRDPLTDRAAARALEQGGAQALAVLRPQLSAGEPSPRVRRWAAHVLGRIGSAEAVALLRELSVDEDMEVRTYALRSLSRLTGAPDPESAASVEARMRFEMAGAHTMWTIATGVNNAVLARALHADGEATVERLFALLAQVYDATVLRRARHTLAYGAADRRSYALELLDNLLAAPHKRLLLPLLEEPAQRAQQAAALLPKTADPDPVAWLTDPANPHLSAWSKACALYMLPQLLPDDPARAQAVVQQALAAPQPLVVEAATWMAHRQFSQAAVADGRPFIFQGGFPMLSTLERVIILKTVDIFRQTSDGILAEIAQLLEELRVSAGQAVFRFGDPGDSLYVVVEGKLRAHRDDKHLNFLGEREVFGEMAALDPAPRMASVTAVEDSLLLMLRQEDLYELMESRVEVSRGIIQVLIRRLRERVDDLSAIRDQMNLAAQPG